MNSVPEYGEVDVPRLDPGSPALSGTGGEPIPGGKGVHFAGAAAVLAIGVAAVIGALRLGYWHRGPGPGFFPLWLGLLLAALALVWAVQIHRAPAVPVDEPAPAGSRRDLLLVLVALGAVVLLLDTIGYQLSMFVFILFVLLVVGRRRWLESLIFAAAAGFGVYALFANVLQVYLPTASLSFLTQLGL